MTLGLFKQKKETIKQGDYAILKKEQQNNYPALSLDSIFTIDRIESNLATVVYFNSNGTKICKAEIAIDALRKVS